MAAGSSASNLLNSLGPIDPMFRCGQRLPKALRSFALSFPPSFCGVLGKIVVTRIWLMRLAFHSGSVSIRFDRGF